MCVAAFASDHPAHTLRSVGDLLATPTEGQDLRKSFFLPLELLNGEKVIHWRLLVWRVLLRLLTGGE